MLVSFLSPKRLVLFRELDVLFVNISHRCCHEQRCVFYLFITYALGEVVVGEMDRPKCHVRGCPLDHDLEPSAGGRGHWLWFGKPCTIVNIQRISASRLLLSFTIKEGLVLRQIAKQK